MSSNSGLAKRRGIKLPLQATDSLPKLMRQDAVINTQLQDFLSSDFENMGGESDYLNQPYQPVVDDNPFNLPYAVMPQLHSGTTVDTMLNSIVQNDSQAAETPKTASWNMKKLMPTYINSGMLLQPTLLTQVMQCTSCSKKSRDVPMKKLDNGDVSLTVIMCSVCVKANTNARYNHRNNILPLTKKNWTK